MWLITFHVVVIEYKVHSYNRNGLCVVGFMDDHYPVRSAFSVLNQVIFKNFNKHRSYNQSYHSLRDLYNDPMLNLD